MINKLAALLTSVLLVAALLIGPSQRLEATTVPKSTHHSTPQNQNKKLPTLVSISISPADQTIAAGGQQQFRATGQFSDGRTKDLSARSTWSSSSSAVASVAAGGLVTAVNAGSADIQASYGSISGSVSVTVTGSIGAEPVPATFFGLQKAGFSSPWYSMPVGASRLYAYESLLWGAVETADGVYDWTVVDKAVDEAVPHGVDLIYTFSMVPSWLSSDPEDTGCNSTKGAGTCRPPSDLCTDMPACTNALGTDQHFKTFVSTLMNHVTAGGNKVSDAVKYYETWAEFNVYSEWGGNDAQMLRLQQDLYATVKAINPNDEVITPTTTGDNSANRLLSYLTQQGPPYPALPVSNIVAFHAYCDNGLDPRGVSPECIIPILQTLNAGLVGTGFDQLPVWDTESSWGSQMSPSFTDGEERAGFVVRSYLLAWANGAKRFYWWAWDQQNSGRLWSSTSVDECTTVMSTSKGYMCSTGSAYTTVQTWMVGHAMTQPCSAEGNVWTCGMDNGLIVWDASQTCSPCTYSNYTMPASYKKSTDVYGKVTSITGSSVKIGYKPILLTTQ